MMLSERQRVQDMSTLIKAAASSRGNLKSPGKSSLWSYMYRNMCLL